MIHTSLYYIYIVYIVSCTWRMVEDGWVMGAHKHHSITHHVRRSTICGSWRGVAVLISIPLRLFTLESCLKKPNEYPSQLSKTTFSISFHPQRYIYIHHIYTIYYIRDGSRSGHSGSSSAGSNGGGNGFGE